MSFTTHGAIRRSASPTSFAVDAQPSPARTETVSRHGKALDAAAAEK